MRPNSLSEPIAHTTFAAPPTFVAIDFETADYGRDSACALALVRVEAGVIVQRAFHYIRPPRARMVFTYLHGISWEQVAGAPGFAQLWPQLQPLLAGAAFLAAHNASFDRAVMRACCAAGAGGLERRQGTGSPSLNSPVYVVPSAYVAVPSPCGSPLLFVSPMYVSSCGKFGEFVGGARFQLISAEIARAM